MSKKEKTLEEGIEEIKEHVRKNEKELGRLLSEYQELSKQNEALVQAVCIMEDYRDNEGNAPC